MATGEVDKVTMAMVIAYAIVNGDKAASRRWNISMQTVEQYRRATEKDKELRAMMHSYLERLEADFDRAVTRGLIKAIGFIEQACESGNPQDPAMLDAITRAMNALAEFKTTIEVLGIANVVQIQDGKKPPMLETAAAQGEVIEAQATTEVEADTATQESDSGDG